ncbi:MAG: hypothetical protein RL154_1237, partial [Pseudomonadota bacterium]
MSKLSDIFYKSLKPNRPPLRDATGNLMLDKKGKIQFETKEIIKDYTITDTKGLSMLITSSGTKYWIVRYKVNSTPKRTSIGTYPEISLEQARKINAEYQSLAKQGISKVELKREEKQQTIINQKGQFHLVAYEWLRVMATKTEPRTHIKRVRAFERDIFDAFCTYNSNKEIVSSKHIADIKHSELLKCIKLKEINAPETAHRLLADCSRLWLFAVSNEYCEHNIVANISKDALVRKTVKHIPKITDEKILSELLNAIDGYTGSTITRNALKFVALMPLRRERLAQLKWEYVDFENETITLPRVIMKNRDANLPEFTLPIPKQAMQILKDTHIITGWGVWIFHGITNFNTHMSLETCNKALRAIGFDNEATGRKQSLHSFRGTYRSLADTHQEQHNASFETKEAVLDHHTSNETVKAYVHQANYVE